MDVGKVMIPANPLLPKSQYFDVKQAPECPLKDITFIQLEKFKKTKSVVAKMGEGFDQLGKKNMMRINADKKKEWDEAKKEKDKKVSANNPDFLHDVKMDEHTSLI